MSRASEAVQGLIEVQDDLPFEVGKPLQSVMRKPRPSDADGEDDAEESSHMAGRLVGREAIIRYLEAGRARFTVRSKRTGTRFTYRATRPSKEQALASAAQRGYSNASRPVWISVLVGQDNVGEYAFLGTVWPSPNGYALRRSAKSHIGEEAPSLRAMQWLCKALNGASDIEQAEVWHEGRCGRCGRVLTVPESVESGFGPECVGRL